jgi:hypothetical protein
MASTGRATRIKSALGTPGLGWRFREEYVQLKELEYHDPDLQN